MQRKISKVFFALFLIVSIVNASSINLSSKRYILYNLNDNKIIDSKNEHERANIASLTKIMTVIVALENIDDLNTEITITKDMISGISWDIHKTGFKEGQKVAYADLLYSAILDSGADAVSALAISTKGSLKAFVKEMNNKVKELKLEDTEFDNVIGKDSPHNYSSAYDLSIILMYALENENFKTIFTTNNYKLTTGKEIKSTLSYYTKKDISYFTGAKTGYYDDAKYCLASTATLNDVNYLFVSLGSYPKWENIIDHIKEYEYFSENYGYQDIITTEDKIVRLNTKYAYEKYIDIYYKDNIKKYVKNDFDKSLIKVKYKGDNEVSFFKRQGSLLGNIDIEYNREVIDNYDVFYNGKLTFNLSNFYHKNETILTTLILLLYFFLAIIFSIKNKKCGHFEVDNK